MIGQLSDAEGEITRRIDSAIQDSIAMAEESNEIEQMMTEEQEDYEPSFFPVSFQDSLIEAFGYDEETFPRSEMNEKILALLKEKYKDVLDKMPEDEDQ